MIAHKFAKKGIKVVINGLPEDPFDSLVAAIKKYDREETANVYAFIAQVLWEQIPTLSHN